MKEVFGKAFTTMIAAIYLTLIMNGYITDPDQINGEVNEKEWNDLSGTIECENGSNSIKCRLLTGSVALNRVKSKDWKGNTVEEVVMAKEGPYWQYAYPTRRDFKTKKCSSTTKAIAKYLLIFGPICPENVMYQGQTLNGSGMYDYCDTPDGKEYFCYE